MPYATETFSYGGKDFVVPLLDPLDEIDDFTPKPPTEIDTSSAIVEAVHTTWDEDSFGKPRLPVAVGAVQNLGRFSLYRGIRILDMPIKLEGTDWRLPGILRPYQGELETMAGYEAAINPDIDEYKAYVTLDQAYVREGETQRNQGLHVDGFQGTRIFPKNVINRSYVASDGTPTAYFKRGFETSHLDPGVDNYFKDFDRQAAAEGYRSVPACVGQIMLMDAYTVHAAQPAAEAGPRTFLRLSFDVLPFDRLGNTPNPLLETGWEMISRDVQSTLN